MSLRPTQPETPAPDAFRIHRAKVDGDLELAFVREGIGGYPLLLVHGYPETKRIWWRNIRPLAEAGFEVIVPDLRGYGDSDLSQDDAYDLVLYSRDCRTLVHDVLGHARCGAIAGDVGGVVICDLANRFPGFVERMIFFNTVPPTDFANPDWYAQRGLSLEPLGVKQLRNIATPIEVYAVGLAAARYPTDPVCRVRVDPATAASSLRHAGHDWWFCSPQCAQRFAAAPTQYA